MQASENNQTNGGLDVAENWNRFLQRLTDLQERLIQNLEQCRRDIQSIFYNQVSVFDEIAELSSKADNLESFREARDELSNKLLSEPLIQWERKRPYKCAMMSIESFDRGCDEIARMLPEEVDINGTRAVELLGELAPGGLKQNLARIRRKPRPLPLSFIVANEFRQLSSKRVKIEGQYLLTLALAILQIRKNWEAARALLDSSAMNAGDVHTRNLYAEKRKAAALASQAESDLNLWREWASATPKHLAKNILDSVLRRCAKKNVKSDERRAACVEHWNKQMRVVKNELRLERTIERSEDKAIGITHGSLESAITERENLLSELEEFINWLQRRINREDVESAIPQPKIDVVPHASRLVDLKSAIQREWKTIPFEMRTSNKFSALPRRRSVSRKIFPQKIWKQAFERAGHFTLAETLRKIQAEQNRIVQWIEQAREVVSFGLQKTDGERELDEQVAEESLQNALSLLQHYRRVEITDWRNEANASFKKALSATFDEARLILSRDRFGVLAHLAQQGSSRAVKLGGRFALTSSKQFADRTVKTVQRIGTKFLINIGWRQATSQGQSEVIIRPFLPQEFTVDLSAKDLPTIYRRLFRFEPVEDPRFLIGRGKEMAAIAEAHAMWKAERPVSLLLLGARGSGKTSLINCSLKKILVDEEIVRGEFNLRMTAKEDLHKALASLLELDDETELESALGSKKCVIILEEIERTFLRQIGHYKAIKELLHLIGATSSSILWILVTNQVAFRFLNASVELGQYFSHRINAASTSRDSLREAILLRHNLSGLRLHFELPPAQQGFFNRIKYNLQGQRDPEKLFFDELARQSAGVFRAAFEIWLGQIDRVEEGVLYIKPLVAPDLSAVAGDLDLNDMFTLMAIMQHGSLTAEEHSKVFQKNLSSSRTQLDELLSREIIEPDPGRPGFRIRPEATRVVTEVLYRRNLL